jgi:uncharacterized protein
MDANSSHLRLNISHLRDLTIEYGEGWGYPHVCRVLRLIDEIGAEMTFNQDVILYATYLHDWGAFPRFRKPGVEHALRSLQVAELEILPYTNLPEPVRQAVLDTISLHDFRDPRPADTIEAHLLREADMLDMLGVVGILREFAWGPNNLKVCYERVLYRRAGIAGRLTLPRAKAIAKERLASMDFVLNRLKEESFELL